MGKNVRLWGSLSHHWTSQKARKQVLVLWGMGMLPTYFALTVWKFGAQLDELLLLKTDSLCNTMFYSHPHGLA